MKIAYLSQYFPPEVGAPAVRVAELSRCWAASENSVSVVTGFPNHPTGVVPPEYRPRLRRLLMRDDREGFRVFRTWLLPLPNRKSWERILNYSSFAASAALRGLLLQKPDVLIATSPQLLVGLSGLIIARCRRVPFVFEVRDLWPESLQAVGVADEQSPMVRILKAIAGLLYRKADHIVVVTHSFKTYLEEEWGVPAEKISVVRNGVDHNLFHPEEPDENIVREFELQDKFVVSYIGTVGNAHGLDTLVSAAEMLSISDPDVLLLVIGDGAEKESVQRLTAEKGLRNLRLHSAHPRARMPALLAASHACLVLLKKSEVFKTVLPTKMMEYMSSGRPVISNVEGEAADLLTEANAGICVAPQDPEALWHAIREIKADPGLRRQLGRNGRAFVLGRLTRERTAEEYLKVLRKVVNGKGSEAFAQREELGLANQIEHTDELREGSAVVPVHPGFQKIETKL
jgi:colanic acid biosynthesis glycosyl transferase WcaI